MAESKDTPADQVHGKVESMACGEEQSDVCEPCKMDNNMLPAVGWCETCDELLCNDCYRGHCRQKMMRNHQLMSITDMKNMKQKKRVSVKCDYHEGEALKYFCEDHSELGCSQCFVTKHRPCNNVVCIADVNTKESKELKDLYTLLSDLGTRLEANKEAVEKNVCRAAVQHDKAVEDITEAEDKLKAQIDVLVKRQISKAQQTNEDNLKRMKSVEEKNKDIAEKLKDGQDILAAECSDNNRLFVTMKYVQCEAGMMRCKLDESVKMNTLPEYVFKLRSELACVLEKIKRLRTLDDTNLLNLEKCSGEDIAVVEARRYRGFQLLKWSDHRLVKSGIGISTDHDILLLYVLVYARDGGDTNVELAISKVDYVFMRCNSTHNRETDHEVVAVNVAQEGGGRGITLRAGHRYNICVNIQGEPGLYYFGTHRVSSVTEKGVTVTFSNAYGFSIAGFRFTII